jgi:hypothetical protein
MEAGAAVVWLRCLHNVTSSMRPGSVSGIRCRSGARPALVLPDDLKRSLVALSGMSELASHPDPLDVFGFYRTTDGEPVEPDDR